MWGGGQQFHFGRPLERLAAGHSHRHRESFARHCSDRTAIRLHAEPAWFDHDNHLVIRLGGAEADRVLAAIRILDDAGRHHDDPAGAPGFHPRRHVDGVVELAGARRHRDGRAGDALKMPGLAVGQG